MKTRVMTHAAFLRTAFLRDHENGAVYALPRRGLKCACCAEPYTTDTRGGSLILDHTYLRRYGPYFLTILCRSCNSRKQSRRWIHVGGGRKWYPGMPPMSRRKKNGRGAALTTATS